MTRWLDLAAWMACVVYSTIPSFWFMIHPRAEYWRSRRRSPYVVLLPAWILMWVVVAAVSAPWRSVSFYSTEWAWLPAIGLFAIGFWLYAQSGKHFSAQQLGGIPELVSGDQQQLLVTKGIRSRVRHPVYLAHFCEMLGWSIGTGLVVCFALTTFAVLTGAVMIRMEEAELKSRFGAAYESYREDVPALLPKLGRHF
ncbi:MAG: isoprenylcysteine carboxylmethyltransferase family protein [Acidobacteriaceae bacterium]|nr:isoprenylcysteine carboxylmethyltransferase family protein [Acidobacteriaceae bacterium]